YANFVNRKTARSQDRARVITVGHSGDLLRKYLDGEAWRCYAVEIFRCDLKRCQKITPAVDVAPARFEGEAAKERAASWRSCWFSGRSCWGSYPRASAVSRPLGPKRLRSTARIRGRSDAR